jgi:hypothetical protein
MNNMSDALKSKLAEVFASKWALSNPTDYEQMQNKFVFHMTDALEDFYRVVQFLQSAEHAEPVAFGKALHAFFLHTLPHLVAAGQLYDFVPELFPEQRGVHLLPSDLGIVKIEDI